MSKESWGDHQISANHKPVKGVEVKAPVRQQYRNRLGEADGATNPYGTGQISREPTSKQPGRPGW